MWTQNWATTQGTGLLKSKAMHDIRLALLERRGALHPSIRPAIPAILTTDLPLNSAKEIDWLVDTQVFLRQLVVLYVNHDAPTPTGVLPYVIYTESSMLTKLGDLIWYPINLTTWKAPVYNQIYRCINQLKFPTGAYDTSTNALTKVLSNDPPDVTIALAKANLDAQWLATPFSTVAKNNNVWISRYYYIPGGWAASGWAAIVTYLGDIIDNTIDRTVITSADYNIYAKMGADPGAGYEYENPYSIPYGQWGTLDSGTITFPHTFDFKVWDEVQPPWSTSPTDMGRGVFSMSTATIWLVPNFSFV